MSRRFNPRCFVFSALLLFAGSLRAADFELVRVWPGWREADTFDRITEYFSGRENTGRHTVLRTRPESRAGYYFLVRVKNPDVETTGLKFNLQIVTPDAPTPKTFTFPAVLDRGHKETIFDIGLTGADWTDKKTHAVAWYLELAASDGRVLASKQSFLWAKP